MSAARIEQKKNITCKCSQCCVQSYTQPSSSQMPFVTGALVRLHPLLGPPLGCEKRKASSELHRDAKEHTRRIRDLELEKINKAKSSLTAFLPHTSAETFIPSNALHHHLDEIREKPPETPPQTWVILPRCWLCLFG